MVKRFSNRLQPLSSRIWEKHGLLRNTGEQKKAATWRQVRTGLSDLVKQKKITLHKLKKITLHNFTNSVILTHSSYTTIRCKPYIWGYYRNSVMVMWLHCLPWVSPSCKNGPVRSWILHRSFILYLNVVWTSSSVRWKKFLCSLWNFTLSLYCGHEEIISSRNLRPLWPQQPSCRWQG